MDDMIQKMPENIKNIIVVSPQIRAKVLEAEKRKILKEYLKVPTHASSDAHQQHHTHIDTSNIFSCNGSKPSRCLARPTIRHA